MSVAKIKTEQRTHICRTCDGEGWILVKDRPEAYCKCGYGIGLHPTTECKDCNGTGHVLCGLTK